jgi:hypothetical protein
MKTAVFLLAMLVAAVAVANAQGELSKLLTALHSALATQ